MYRLLRLLEVCKRELGATSTYIEIGAHTSNKPEFWKPLAEGVRLVAEFDERPQDVAATKKKLAELAQMFGKTTSEALAEIETLAPRPPHDAAAPGHLFDALDALANRARAESAAIIDDRSPEIWSSSLLPRGPRDVDEAQQVASAVAWAIVTQLDLPALLEEPDPGLADKLIESGMLRPGEAIELQHRIDEMRAAGARLRQPSAWRLAQSLSKLRNAERRGMPREDKSLYLARPFGGIYRVVVVLPENDASPMHAEAALIKAVPLLENLIERLPPRDPGPGKGAVIRQLRPR